MVLRRRDGRGDAPGRRRIDVRAALAAVGCAAMLGSCGGTDITSTSVPAAPPPPAPVATFTVYPKYFIGSVIYVPPGAGSSIAYGPGTVTGTTVSTSSNWSSASSAGVQTGLTANGSSITFGDDFGGATTQSVDVQNTSLGETATYNAPASDLINHDYDQILIFPGVNVNASVYSQGNVAWGMDFSQMAKQGFVQSAYAVWVGCLRPNSTISSLPQCATQVNQLSAWGITQADYPNITGADPFADPNASQTPDPSRYVLVYSFSYIPTPTAVTYTWTTSNRAAAANAQTSSYSYTVSSDVSTSYDGVSLKDPSKFTWTNSSTLSNETGSSSSTTLVLVQPSFSYIGPFTLFVYLDTIYKTFMFSFVPRSG